MKTNSDLGRRSNQDPEPLERQRGPMNSSAEARPRRLPKGQHPGQAKLKSQPGVYRCCLHPDIHKKKPEFADYKGVMEIAGSKVSVLLWIHVDGSLGLRLEKIRQPEPANPPKT